MYSQSNSTAAEQYNGSNSSSNSNSNDFGYRRRKQSDSWIRWTKRGVVSSPLILLIVWAMVFVVSGSRRQVSLGDSSYGAVRIPVRPQHLEEPSLLAVRIPVRPHRQFVENQVVMLQPNPNIIAAQQTKLARNSKVIVVQPPDLSVGMLATQSGNKIPILRSTKQQQAKTITIGTSVNSIPVLTNTMDTVIETQDFAEDPPMSNAISPPENQAEIPPPLDQKGILPVYSPIGASIVQPNPLGEPIPLTNIDVGASVVRRRPHPNPRLTQIYYYDSSQIRTGDFVIPTTVYAADGTPVDIEALRATNAEIYIEPPPPRAARQLNIEPPAQDQYIIIATVAVMALLVGALSARRLRAKNLLSSCIENESLEDELAYDTAYTTSAGKYDTFGPWKGDLEKFDV